MNGTSHLPAQLPLLDVRVVDLSRLIAGNQLTMLLGDFGADVIKIEQPGVGDPLRRWRVDGRELFWSTYGRNKRSVELDLKDEHERDVLLDLVKTADLVVESFRPGVLARLGLSADTLRARNSRLVVVRISGWGQTGVFAELPGFGTLVEAMSGFASMNGFADREPVLPPGALADMVAGTYGAFGAVMAIRYAEATGQGQDIDLSLFEPLFSILGPQAAEYKILGRPHQRSGSRSHTSAPRNVYRCSDGRWIALSASTQPVAERLFEAIGRADLIEDERFLDNSSRLANVEQLDAILTDHFGRSTLDTNLERLRSAGVTVAPVCDIGDLINSDYFLSREVVIDGPSQIGGSDTIPMHNVVPRMTASPGSIRRPAPRLGEHTDEVLATLWSERALEGPTLSGGSSHD